MDSISSSVRVDILNKEINERCLTWGTSLREGANCLESDRLHMVTDDEWCFQTQPVVHFVKNKYRETVPLYFCWVLFLPLVNSMSTGHDSKAEVTPPDPPAEDSHELLDEAGIDAILGLDQGSAPQSSMQTCGRCKSPDVGFHMAQTRSADEAMSVLLKCRACKHTWKIR
jgi:DNA-directed RNA polymerase subunit M/transcription elongation factor TFIIS